MPGPSYDADYNGNRDWIEDEDKFDWFWEHTNEDITSRRFIQLYKAAQRDSWDIRPYGPFAKFLEAIGLREPDAPYPVGETPEI